MGRYVENHYYQTHIRPKLYCEYHQIQPYDDNNILHQKSMGPTGPTSSWRPFGPAFGPSGLLTHYPTANTLSNPWIVCQPLSNFGAAVDSVLARIFCDGAAGGAVGIPYSRITDTIPHCLRSSSPASGFGVRTTLPLFLLDSQTSDFNTGTGERKEM